MALSPYLNSHPIDLSLALGKYSGISRIVVNDYVQINLYVNDALVHTTGPIRPFSLIKHESEYVGRHPRKAKIRAEIVYTKHRLSQPIGFRQAFPVTPRYPRNGSVRVRISGPVARSSQAYGKVSSRAQRSVKDPWNRQSRNFFPSPVRPDPERITKQFLTVNEVGHNFVKETDNQTVVPITAYFRNWSGTRTPGYGKKKTRSLPDNPHSSRVTEVSENRYHWYQEQIASGSWSLTIAPYSDFYGMPDSPTLFIDAAEFQALQRLIDHAGTGLKGNMAQNIAQVGQLTTMIAGTTSKIMGAYRNARRGKLGKAVDILTGGTINPKWRGKPGNPSKSKDLASNWLELQYGWKPLLHDIEDFMEAAGRLNSPNDFVQRASASATAKREYRLDFPPAGVATGSTVGKTIYLVSTTCKFKIRFRVDSPINAFLAQTGFTNPINLAWEILPFSFVADWFLPIGDYLQTLSAWDGITFLGGSKVRFTRIRGDSTFDYHGPHGVEPTIRLEHTAAQRREEIRLVRDVLSTFPSSVLPSFNGAGLQAGARAANAVALVVSTFKR